MTKTKYTLAIFAEQCMAAGQRCYDESMIERESDDLEIYEFTSDDELRAFAAVERPTNTTYGVRRAETIQDFADEVLKN